MYVETMITEYIPAFNYSSAVYSNSTSVCSTDASQFSVFQDVHDCVWQNNNNSQVFFLSPECFMLNENIMQQNIFKMSQRKSHESLI